MESATRQEWSIALQPLAPLMFHCRIFSRCCWLSPWLDPLFIGGLWSVVGPGCGRSEAGVSEGAWLTCVAWDVEVESWTSSPVAECLLLLLSGGDDRPGCVGASLLGRVVG